MRFKQIEQFLVDKNCLRNFINACLVNVPLNRKKANIEFLTNVERNTNNPIRSCFIWANTKEGRDYWCRLASDFDEYLINR